MFNGSLMDLVCVTGPLSKMSGLEPVTVSGSHLFCSTNESEFQEGAIAHRCSYLRRAAFWMHEIELFSRI